MVSESQWLWFSMVNYSETRLVANGLLMVLMVTVITESLGIWFAMVTDQHASG